MAKITCGCIKKDEYAIDKTSKDVETALLLNAELNGWCGTILTMAVAHFAGRFCTCHPTESYETVKAEFIRQMDLAKELLDINEAAKGAVKQ